MKLLAACAAASIVACATDAPATDPPAPARPDWVNRGASVLEGDVIYTVGSASGIRNRSLARATADNRARAEVSKVFQTYLASLMTDYAASTAKESGEEAGDETRVGGVIKTFSARVLVGVEIVDHWVDPADGTVFSRARLDLDLVTQTASREPGFSDTAKARLVRSAAVAAEALRQQHPKAPPAH